MKCYHKRGVKGRVIVIAKKNLRLVGTWPTREGKYRLRFALSFKHRGFTSKSLRINYPIHATCNT